MESFESHEDVKPHKKVREEDINTDPDRMTEDEKMAQARSIAAMINDATKGMSEEERKDFMRKIRANVEGDDNTTDNNSGDEDSISS